MSPAKLPHCWLRGDRSSVIRVRIAQVAQSNFLVAGLVARAHGLHDTSPVDPGRVVFPADVATALRTYLRRLETGGPA